MKENLRFLVRGATATHGYSFTADQNTRGGSGWYPTIGEEASPEYYFARPETSTNYEYAGFHTYDPILGYSFVQELRPIYDNYLLRNLAFDDQLLDQTGAWSFDDCALITRQIWGAYYSYVSPGNETNASLSLVATNGALPFIGVTYEPTNDCFVLPECGLSVVGTNLLLVSGAKNCFGLNISSVKYYSDVVHTLQPGTLGNFSLTGGGEVYLGTDMPNLVITNYYFASQLPYFTYITNATAYSPDLPAPPFPGAPSFSPSNPAPVLVAPFGKPFTIAGWAKMAIANGYAGKYAYLEQYWDRAYKIGTNGLATTTETGVLSPYGEFFPTEPGPTALVTMPDADTGQSGASLVQVIKLQLDVNHDGGMDLTFGGPDNTSQDRPFVFWVNDDYDRWHPVGPDREEDDLERNDRDASAPLTFGMLRVSDCKYPNGPAYRLIPCPRDLEDFARLWVVCVTSNLLTSLPPGTTGELSWGDKNNPNPNNPTIDLFAAAEPNGGMGYLSNYWSITQTNGSDYPCIGTIGPGQSVTVFSNSWS